MQQLKQKHPAITSNIPKKDLDSLKEMGFPEEQIHIAYTKSKHKGLTKLSDYLLNNQKKIQATLEYLHGPKQNENAGCEPDEASSKHNFEQLKSDSLNSNQKAMENQDKKPLQAIQEKSEIQSEGLKDKKEAANPDNIKVSKKKALLKKRNVRAEEEDSSDSSESDEIEEEKSNKWRKDHMEFDLSHVPPHLSSEAKEGLKALYNVLNQIKHETPLERTMILYDAINRLKHFKGEENQEILDALGNITIKEGLLAAVRTKIFKILNGIFKTKLDKARKDAVIDLVYDFSTIETTVLNTMKFLMFDRIHYKKLKASYNYFCTAMKMKPNREIMSFDPGADRDRILALKKNQMENENAHGWDNVEDESDDSADKLKPGEKNSKDDPLSELHINKNVKSTSNQSAAEAQEKPKKNTGKSYCAICRKRTKEIVFLPCSHFVSCSECSPDYAYCPACSNPIETKLRIYWS